MRASTLFALTVAILIGLGVAVAARMSGYFNPQKVSDPVAAKKQDVLVLAASKNLFAGDLIDAAGVRVRPLRAEELEHYNKNKDSYVPALPAAAALRVADKNIEADQPILKTSLKEMAKPTALNTRLLPNMRAVNLSLPRERTAGGMIQVGEWVDILLTTSVENKQDGSATVRTACIVPHVRVIAKRNTLWPVFAPLPEDKPVHFTLEVNPYRAALLDFCLNKGQLTLALLPASDQKKLEEQRAAFLENEKDAFQVVQFAPPGKAESDDESNRVNSFNRGELVVTEGDLVRIFDLKPTPTPAPPEPTVTIERVAGLQRFEPAVFNQNGTVAVVARNTPQARSRPTVQAAPSFQFQMPNCSTCGTKKK